LGYQWGRILHYTIIQPKEECNYSVTIIERAIKYLIIAAYQLGNIERAIKHWTIGASTGHYNDCMIALVTQGAVSKESID